MKRIILFVLIIFNLSLFSQECYQADWAKAWGGASSYNGIVDGDRMDDGRFVLLGTFGNGNMQLDTFTLSPIGSYNVFLAIMDSSGSFQQAKVIAYGNGGYFTPTALDAGLDGRVHITGYYEGSNIHLNDSLLKPTSAEQVWIASYESDLSPRWNVVSDRVGGDARAYDVSGGPNGGVFVIGNYEANAFRIGNNAIENFGGWNLWRDDALIVKLDSMGQVELMKSIGTPNDESGSTITVDAQGNFFVTGNTNQSSDVFKFDDQTGIPGAANNYGFYFAKYDGLSGKCLWARIGGGLFSYSQMYSTDACRGDNGSIYLTGKISGTVSLHPHTYTSYDGDAFLAKIDAQGNTQWFEKIGGQNSSENGVDVSYHNGRVAVTGRLFSNYTYVGDFPLSSTPPGNGFDAFNAMFDIQGDVIWARGNDGSSFSNYYPSIVLIDDDGNQIYIGSFKGTQEWYPLSLTNSSSNSKIFFVKFSESSSVSFSVSAGQDKSTSCSSYATLDGSVSPSAVEFGWTPDLGFFNNGDLTPNVTPKQPTRYILHGFYQGCIKTDTVFVDISNYNLTANAGSDTLFCRGGSVQLGDTTGLGAASFSWSPQSYLSSASAGTPTADPPYPTDYVLTVSLGGCEAMDTVSVYPQNLPYIYLPKQDQYGSYYRIHLCQGDPLEIDLGDPANTYLASPASMLLGANNNLITIDPQSTGGILTVNATDSLGCTNQDAANIIIHNTQTAPPITGTVPNRTACDGDSLEILINLTHSTIYQFQYSWYAGWEIDKGDGQGWQEISYWDNQYDVFNYSVGYPSSTYYTRLQIPLVESFMDGYRIRCWLEDYCSPRSYSNAATISIGPKITQHPQSTQLCAGVTDSISANSSSANVSYHWEIYNNGSWDSLVSQPGFIVTNGRFLRFVNASAAHDSLLVRCRMTGCSPQDWVYTDSALIRVIPKPDILWQSMDDSVCEGTIDSLVVIANEGPWNYQWYENNNPLTYNTSQRCCYNTNKLTFTPVYLIQNNYYYKLHISNSQCNVDTFSIPVRFYVSPTASASWPGGNLDFCEGDPAITLSGGSPAGGSYSGPGITGATFDPSLAGPGVHTVYYGYSGPSGYCSDSASRTFTVHAAPNVSWPGGSMEWCEFDGSYPLGGGIPVGGVYSGPGVNGSSFDPILSGAGTFTLSYTYTDPVSTCTDTANRIMEVIAGPVVSWPSADTAFCLSGAQLITLSGGIPAGGSYSGPGVSNGVFEPWLVGAGIHLLSYTYLDPVTFCSNLVDATFTINPDPVISWNGDTAVCYTSGPYIPSGAFPTGGTYYGNAVSAGQFEPILAGYGYDTIYYAYTDPITGCSDTVIARVYVDPCPGLGEDIDPDLRVYQKGGMLIIDSKERIEIKGEIYLLNGLGQLVARKSAQQQTSISIDVSHLNPGPYILNLETASTILRRKVILY